VVPGRVLYAKFDRQARDILDGRQRLFWIDDPARTDLAQYPPAFPAFVALIYKVSGDRSAYSVQIVVWFLDLILSLLLIGGIALLLLAGARQSRAVSSWGYRRCLRCTLRIRRRMCQTHGLCLAGNWLLLLALQRKNVWLALAAGVVLGIACWLRVNPLYLCVGWAIALFVLVKDAWLMKLKMGAACWLELSL
jgi:hypothetical protein